MLPRLQVEREAVAGFMQSSLGRQVNQPCSIRVQHETAALAHAGVFSEPLEAVA